MPEFVNFGLTTAFVKNQFRFLIEKQGSLAKAIITLLNRDKYLNNKYRFRSLANCEVWQEQLRPGVDSLSHLSSVLHMLDTYVKFNRLESRSAAIEELLQATVPDEVLNQDRNKSNETNTELDDLWNIFKPPRSDRFPSGEFREVQVQTDPMSKFSILSAVTLVNSSTQTSRKKHSLSVLHAFGSRSAVVKKDASVQTETHVPFKKNKISTAIVSSTQGKLQPNANVAKTGERDSLKHLGQVVEKLLSPNKLKKKSSIFSRETLAKRPRKTAPLPSSTAPANLVPAMPNKIAAAAPSPKKATNSQIFSGAPVFNSIAPSQQPSCVSSSSFPALPGNVYFYRGQQGIPFTVSHLQQQQLKTNLVLNPRVVISPLPIMSSPEMGTRPNLLRSSFDDNEARNFCRPFYPLQVRSQNMISDHSQKNTEIEVEKNLALKKPVAHVLSTKKLVSPVCQPSNDTSSITCKQEYPEESSYPLPSTTVLSTGTGLKKSSGQ